MALSQTVVRSCRYCSGDQSCRPCEGCNLEGGSTNRLGPLRREARQPRARQRFSLNIGRCCSELLIIVSQGCRGAFRRDDRQWEVGNGLEGARSMLAGGLFWSLPVEWDAVHCMFAVPVARDKKKGVIYRQPEDCPRRRGEGAGYGERVSRGLSWRRQGEERRQMNWDPTFARRGLRANIFQAVNLELRAEPGRTVGKNRLQQGAQVCASAPALASGERSAEAVARLLSLPESTVPGWRADHQKIGRGIIHESPSVKGLSRFPENCHARTYFF